MSLAGALVWGGVEKQVVGDAIAIHGTLDLLASLLGLLHPTHCLHSSSSRCQSEQIVEQTMAVYGMLDLLACLLGLLCPTNCLHSSSSACQKL